MYGYRTGSAVCCVFECPYTVLFFVYKNHIIMNMIIVFKDSLASAAFKMKTKI